MSGVSTLFISDLINGKGYPSLGIMERITDELDKSLTEFLEEADLDSNSLEALAGSKLRGTAYNHERVSLIPPPPQDFIIQQWIKDVMKQMKKYKVENEKTSRKT